MGYRSLGDTVPSRERWWWLMKICQVAESVACPYSGGEDSLRQSAALIERRRRKVRGGVELGGGVGNRAFFLSKIVRLEEIIVHGEL